MSWWCRGGSASEPADNLDYAQASDPLYCLFAEHSGKGWIVPKIVNLEDAPAPRQSAACVMVGTDMWVFGGSSRTALFNDMYKFDTGTVLRLRACISLKLGRMLRTACDEHRWCGSYGCLGYDNAVLSTRNHKGS